MPSPQGGHQDGAKQTMKNKHRGQTFAHARVVVRAELSARTKTEEKYISGRFHEALEKRVNKIMGKIMRRNTRKILRNSLPYIFRCFIFVFLFSPHSFVYNLPLLFPRFSEISHMRVTFDRGVGKIWLHGGPFPYRIIKSIPQGQIGQRHSI